MSLRIITLVISILLFPIFVFAVAVDQTSENGFVLTQKSKNTKDPKKSEDSTEDESKEKKDSSNDSSKDKIKKGKGKKIGGRFGDKRF
ncbi:MAG: hypothetical protein IPL26_11840 [Leptospiraceae bacterium]|nr:hypothetical protein [Leptospiraceae bacterium]